MTPLTVACVLRSGGVYTPDWVLRLKRGVKRNITVPYRFVCLSDIDVPVERILLETKWRGWWSKLELFQQLTGPTLYFDLDTVITGSLDAIARHPHNFTAAHDYYRPQMMCSTAMAWNGDFSFITKAFAANPNGLSHEYDHKVRPRVGDQAFIEDQLAARGMKFDTFRDLFGERTIASYKVHKCEAGPPDDAAAVAFHGKPKPQDLSTGWVPALWR